MKALQRHVKAFTLVELIVASTIAILLSAGLLLYSSFAIRMVSRNLATNHSHEVARGTFDRMLRDLHNSASKFYLVNFDGSSFTDVASSSGTDQDIFTGQLITPRANGVKFMQFVGGPYRLVGDGVGASPVLPTSTNLQFDFGVGGQLPYVPKVGDKVQFPLINSVEFYITGIPTPPTAGNTRGVVTLSSALGFTLYTSGTTPAGVTNPVTTGYFYKRLAYSVWNDPSLGFPTYQIRYHPNYPLFSGTNSIVVRYNVTSPKPFALLLSGTGLASDNLNLRVSLEAYDMQYSARQYQNATTTLQSIIPSRTQPPPLVTGT